jgi:hypothetical protein
MEESSKENGIPHLRAVVHYGQNPLDELFAISMMILLSSDLLQYYNYKVGIECWDIDDGQILLIEGANYLPSWIDDEIGVEAMTKRVYIVNGQIQVLPACYQGQQDQKDEKITGKYILSRKESLNALIHFACQENDDSLIGFNRAILKRMEPFCKALSHKMEFIQQRNRLHEHVHTAAVVAPMHLATVLKYYPELIPTAILAFCRHVSEDVTNVQAMAKKNKSESVDAIPFEHLVFTKITIPKTLYAMLITGAGQLPPPMKTPRHYISMELSRIKRQCENGSIGYAHLRHAVETGIRLSLGYEWIMLDNQIKTSNVHPISNHLLNCSVEERILKHTTRIDVEAGGDGRWLHSSWSLGPNKSPQVDDISTLAKCPVWYPEIVQGGICPISKPGEFILNLHGKIEMCTSSFSQHVLLSINFKR